MSTTTKPDNKAGNRSTSLISRALVHASPLSPRPPLGERDSNGLSRNLQTHLACDRTSSNMAIEPQQKQPREKKMATTTMQSRTAVGRHTSPRIAGSSTPHKSPTLSKESQWDRTPQRSRIEDIVSPITTILSSNITPRSGSRKARVDSASSTPVDTPAGTPIRSRPTSTVGISNGAKSNSTLLIGPGSKCSSGQGGKSSANSVPNASRQLPSPPLLVNGKETSSPEAEPKFFHASEVKDMRISRSTPQRIIAQQQKSPCFIYANGELDESPPASSVTTSPMTSETPFPKFFHANGILESNSEAELDSRTETFSPYVKNFSQLDTSRPSPKQGTFSPVPLHRPPSPLKEVNLARKNSKESSPRSSVVSSSKPLRRSSLKSAVQTPSSHSRSKSVASIEPSLNARVEAKGTAPTNLNTTVSGTFAEEPTSSAHALKKMPILPFTSVHSPTKTVFDSSSDLAATARRERKVLDLEISNSSLLAINRTLEREMRKQHNELRRYRRLTHAGRLSLAKSYPSISSRRSTLASEDSELSENENGLDFETSEYGDVGDEENESTPSINEEPLSPSTRQRAKDAKRLQLDLSKHHELIVDGQKLNQSIKRCLCRTDTLIEEGRKALSYTVRLSEVGATGGRVLRRDETGMDNDEIGRGSALLSPGLEGVEEFVGDESAILLNADIVLNQDLGEGNDSRESVLSMIPSPDWKKEVCDDDTNTAGMAN